MKSVSIGNTVRLDELFAYHVDSKNKERGGITIHVLQYLLQNNGRYRYDIMDL